MFRKYSLKHTVLNGRNVFTEPFCSEPPTKTNYAELFTMIYLYYFIGTFLLNNSFIKIPLGKLSKTYDTNV